MKRTPGVLGRPSGLRLILLYLFAPCTANTKVTSRDIPFRMGVDTSQRVNERACCAFGPIRSAAASGTRRTSVRPLPLEVSVGMAREERACEHDGTQEVMGRTRFASLPQTREQRPLPTERADGSTDTLPKQITPPERQIPKQSCYRKNGCRR